MIEFGEKWVLNPGDGAFYGPKVSTCCSNEVLELLKSKKIAADHSCMDGCGPVIRRVRSPVPVETVLKCP